MKKIIIAAFPILIIFLLGCSNVANEFESPYSDEEAKDSESIYNEKEYEGVVSAYSCDIDYYLNEFPLSFEMGVDDKLALEIGTAIVKSIWNTDKIDNIYSSVCEVENRNVYIVTAAKTNVTDGIISLYDGYSVVINKENGAIVKVWVNE
ncbi:MAG: hypothetical protein LUG66_09395 [Clostridiales bacterium]|nr:hypothetical protein [Clostridiales bacterium]